MRLYLYFTIISFSVILISCQKQEITNYNGELPIYAEGYLESGGYAVLHLSNTMDLSILRDEYYAQDSSIEVYSKFNLHAILLKDGIIVDSLTGPIKSTSQGPIYYSRDHWWYLHGNSHIVEPGGNYQMVIKRTGHPDIIANCIVPNKVDFQIIDTIDNIKDRIYSPEDSPDSIGKRYYFNPMKIRIQFTDPSSQMNYYKIECFGIYRKSTILNNIRLNGWHEFAIDDIPLFEGHVIISDKMYIPESCFFNDKLFNGKTQSVDIYCRNILDSLISIRFYNITGDYYKRLKSSYLFEKAQIDRYSTPVQIYGNFTNALGFLAGCTISTINLNIRLNYY